MVQKARLGSFEVHDGWSDARDFQQLTHGGGQRASEHEDAARESRGANRLRVLERACPERRHAGLRQELFFF